jgi:uncharacterized protein (DUF1015 family)
MSLLRPFYALRPQPAQVAEVAAVPYDVVDRHEAAALAAGRPRSFLHVSRSEIDLPSETHPYDDAVYARAAANFGALQDDGTLVVEPEACLYIYRLQMGGQQQTGIAATFAVDEYDADRIKKHERTRKDKEDDRTRHIIELRAQTGPVFLAHRPIEGLDELVAGLCQAPPLYDFTAPDGVVHTVWKVTDTEPLCQRFAGLDALYIADGHHRAASASRTRARLREQALAAGAPWTGDEEANFFLAVAFPANQLRVLPYNRLIADLRGQAPESFLAAVTARFGATPGASPAPAAAQQVSMYLGGTWYGLNLASVAPLASTPADALDVALLQEHLLAPLLGISDPRTDKRIDFVGGIRGTAELEEAVNKGRAAVAFSMYPTSVEELMAIADADQIMPPKSTWFEPKLRDAIVIHTV